MRVLQIAVSIPLMVVSVGSLVYLLLLAVKVTINRIGKKKATRQLFIVTFCQASSILALAFIWSDEVHWTVITILMAIALWFGASIVYAGVATAGMWIAKNNWPADNDEKT